MESELDQDSSGLLRKRKLETLTSDDEPNQLGARPQDGSLPRKVICLSKLPKQLIVPTSNKGILPNGSFKIQHAEPRQNIISSSTNEGLKLKIMIKSQTRADQSSCQIPKNNSGSGVLLNDGAGRKIVLLHKGPSIALPSGSNNIIKSISSSKPVLDMAEKVVDFTSPDDREIDSTDSGISSRTSSPYEPIHDVPNNVSDMIFPCLDAAFTPQSSSSNDAFYPNLKTEVKQEHSSPSSSPPTSSEAINQASGTVPRKVIVIAPPSTIPPINGDDHLVKEESFVGNPNLNTNLIEAKSKFKLVARPMKERWDRKLASLTSIKEEKEFTRNLQDAPQPVFDTVDGQLLDWKTTTKAENAKEIKEEIESDYSEREPSLLDKILEQDRILYQTNMERLKAMTDPVIKGPRPFVKEWKKHAIGKDFMVYNFSIDFYFIFLKTLLVRAKVLNGSENIVFRYEGVKREDTYTLRQAHEGQLPELVDMLIHVGQIEDVYIYFVPSSIKPAEGLEDPSLKFELREARVAAAVGTAAERSDKLSPLPEITKNTKGKKSAKGDSEKNEATHYKKVQLWQFILVTLLEGQHKDKVIWMGDNGGFKFINQHEFSKLWASFKGKEDMTYSNLSRSIRNYYKQGIVEKGDNNRFSYKFTFDAEACTGYSISQMRSLYEAADPNDLDKLEKLKGILAQPLKAAMEGTAPGTNEELPDCDDDTHDSDD